MTAKPGIVFKVLVNNGKIIYDHPNLFEQKLKRLDGKRCDLVIEECSKAKSHSQLGYYWGGIIEATCLETETFGGWTKEEVHDYLIKTLRSHAKEIIHPTHREIVTVHDSMEKYDMEEMKKYVNDVVIFLANNHQINVLSPDEYRYQKYYSVREPAINTEEF